MLHFFRDQRRQRLRAVQFPPEWLRILKKNFALYHRLPRADQEELQGLIQVFLAEKAFEGCAGLRITDEIRVTIAAQACLLLLHRESDCYPGLSTVLVYPSAYLARTREQSPIGVVTEGEMARLGEAWDEGPVVLSWDEVRAGAADVRDGENVALHEFAHKLDEENGVVDGTPPLQRRSMYVAWARVLKKEYERLRRDTERGRETVLDKYGATNPTEFFAVATEAFFERPVQLKRRHPRLYDELKQFYRQDPVQFAPDGENPSDGPGAP